MKILPNERRQEESYGQGNNHRASKKCLDDLHSLNFQ